MVHDIIAWPVNHPRCPKDLPSIERAIEAGANVAFPIRIVMDLLPSIGNAPATRVARRILSRSSVRKEPSTNFIVGNLQVSELTQTLLQSCRVKIDNKTVTCRDDRSAVDRHDVTQTISRFILLQWPVVLRCQEIIGSLRLYRLPNQRVGVAVLKYLEFGSSLAP